MLRRMSRAKELLDSLPQVGRLEWIGLAPKGGAPLESVDEAEVRPGTGLEGDHHARLGRSQRQVSLIQEEHFDVIARLCGRESVEPGEMRRNLVVSGINLQALKKRRFRLGEVALEGVGDCDPCHVIERNLGPGGFNASKGHAGIVARVLRGGTIRVGDPIELVPEG